jgi:hypothetical protein
MVAGKLFVDRPVPLPVILALRAISGSRDGLLPAWESEAYSMADVDLALLARCLRRLRPSIVLEFGCGDSTIQTARILAEIHGDDIARLVSVEQDSRFAKECSERLDSEGLNAKVVDRPLTTQPSPGGETQSYDLTELGEVLAGRAPDLIVIDGPSGGRYVRYPVLPNVRPYLAGTTPFLLHDGLRDYELLRVAKAWRAVPGITIDGVYVGGEGLLAGTVRP